MNAEFGWQPFRHKHHELRFTRFIEDFWFPKKYGFDKRRAHLSSLVLTGQLTREDALKRISKPELDIQTSENEKRYVANKLGFSESEFEELFIQQNRTFRDYKSKRWLINLGIWLSRICGIEKRLLR